MKHTLLLLLASSCLFSCTKTVIIKPEPPVVESRLQQSGNEINLAFEHELYAEFTELNHKPLNITFSSGKAIVGQKATIILNSQPNDITVIVTGKQRYEFTGVLSSQNIRRIVITYLGSDVILVDATT